MAEVLASVEDLHDKPDKVRARGNERFPVNMTDLSTKNPNHDPLINEVLVYPASVPDVQATRLLMLREHGDEVPAMAHVLQGVSPHPQEMSTIVTAGHHHEVNLR